MKIKRFNEKSETNPEDVVVRVSFDGDIVIPLKSIKKTEYFERYVGDVEDDIIEHDEYESAIYYGVEEYIHTSGICNYKISYQTSDGEPILDLEAYEELMKNTGKYNI
jgi:hypothetical protein